MQSLKLIAVATIAILTIGATKPAPRQAPRNWANTLTVTPGGGHQYGNPAAALKLVEYVSYTCQHCATFERESDTPLKINYVASGRVSVEVRHVVRDPVDLVVAMLTNCGTPNKFAMNHSVFMRSQPRWMQILQSAPETQRQRWLNGTRIARSRAIATDFRFYDIMATRGYDRVAVDRCLADQSLAERLGKMTEDAGAVGITGTPSFTLNAELLGGTHNWSMLKLQLDARL